ncbi:hypothetical protein EVAR_65642_1 [Eumeta japonica]|uniref:Uncharacterized protein n=1 Tax=Eumeta variegata TaxID=151549 RepID=A0A4C1Z8X8_EUMVA|nr:hypothetical protein EVAR_65642_1 [Eumeta japonica]
MNTPQVLMPPPPPQQPFGAFPRRQNARPAPAARALHAAPVRSPRAGAPRRPRAWCGVRVSSDRSTDFEMSFQVSNSDRYPGKPESSEKNTVKHGFARGGSDIDGPRARPDGRRERPKSERCAGRRKSLPPHARTARAAEDIKMSSSKSLILNLYQGLRDSIASNNSSSVMNRVSKW